MSVIPEKQAKKDYNCVVTYMLTTSAKHVRPSVCAIVQMLIVSILTRRAHDTPVQISKPTVNQPIWGQVKKHMKL